jgi:CRP-like cAMP-binding protein
VAESAADLLKRVPIFSDLDRKELERIASSMKQRTFNAGDTVTSEGQSGVGFFVIEDGEAKVTVGGEERRRLGPGDYFGEVALAMDVPRTASVRALTPATVASCDRETFDEYLRPLFAEDEAN